MCTNLGPNDARNPELPRNDSSMTGAASLVCYDGSCHLHDGFPVRIRHGSDQHLTLPKLTDVGAILNNMGGSLADLRSHCLAGKDNRAGFLELIGFDGFLLLDGMHRLWPCLYNEELSFFPVLCPFDIHWLEVAGLFGVMVLYDTCPSRKGKGLVIA